MPAVAAVVMSPVAASAGLASPWRGETLSEMRDFLGRQAPASASDALRLLRVAFPDAPLSMRVAACGLTES